MFGFGKKKKQDQYLDQKGYPAASYFINSGNYQFPRLSPESLAREGYKMNPIAFRCIHMIKQAVSSIEVCLYSYDSQGNKRKVENHPAIKLLNNPNPAMSKSDFIGYVAAYYLINGNSYIFNNNPDGKPAYLWTIAPQDIKIIAGNSMPSAYEVSGFKKVKDMQHSFPVNPITGQSAILQIKDFDPLDYFYGQSRLQAAAFAIDTFNESLRWNYSLLKNGAKPDGFLTPKGDNQMTEEQYNHAYEMVEREFNGSSAAGGTKLLGNFEWTQASLSPKDMDFRESQIMAARYIANCFGVPSQLLNIPESQTFSNYEQANLSFWQDTVIPIAENIYSALNRWLFTFYKEDGFCFELSLDNISALDVIKKSKSERLKAEVEAGIRTINEARRSLGLEDIQGGDELYINGSQIPLSFASDIESQIEEEAKSQYEKFIKKEVS